MINIIKEYLPISEYYREQTTKNKIVLHHTVSSSKQSTTSWWIKDGIHVATAFIIDKDGQIYELFDPTFWSYHLGSGTVTLDNKAAIGIELVNEGQLYKREDNTYYWWIDKDNPFGKAKYNGEVFDNGEEWRDFRYWAKYTSPQIDSVIKLLKYLTEKFNINIDIITSYLYDKSLLNYNGIISHHNVRKDKTDVSPALNLNMIKSYLMNEYSVATHEKIDNVKISTTENINTHDEKKTKGIMSWLFISRIINFVKKLKIKLI